MTQLKNLSSFYNNIKHPSYSHMISIRNGQTTNADLSTQRYVNRSGVASICGMKATAWNAAQSTPHACSRSRCHPHRRYFFNPKQDTTHGTGWRSFNSEYWRRLKPGVGSDRQRAAKFSPRWDTASELRHSSVTQFTASRWSQPPLYPSGGTRKFIYKHAFKLFKTIYYWSSKSIQDLRINFQK